MIPKVKAQLFNMISIRWLYVLVGVLAFLQFSNTLTYGYVWDDVIVVEKNEKVKNGLSNITSLWVRNKSNELSDQYGFRPLVLMSYALETQLWGLRPQMSHLINVLLFSFLSVVVFKFFTTLFYARILSFAATLIFITHPVHAEVVANIKSRDEIMALLFAISSAIIMLKYVNVNFIKTLMFVSVLFLMGMLSKENNVVYAMLIPILAIWFSNISFIKIIFSTLILSSSAAVIIPGTLLFKLLLAPTIVIACSLLYFIYRGMSVSGNIFSKHFPIITAITLVTGLVLFTWYANNFTTFISSAQITNQPLKIITDDVDGLYLEDKVLGNPLFGLPTGSLTQISANAFLILGKYLQGFLFPTSQHYYYGFNQMPLVFWDNWLVLFSAFLHILLFSWAIYLIPRYKELSFALIFYLISIAPYTQVLKLLDDFMADRFMFAPSLALCMVLALVLWRYGKLNKLFEWLQAKWNGEKKLSINSLGLQSLLSGVLLLIVVPSFAYQTYNRSKVWKDNFTLVGTDLPKMQNCSRAHYFYANECFNKYIAEKNPQQKLFWQNEIIEHYTKSKNIHKAAYFAYIGLVRAHMTFYQPDKALKVLKELLALYPHLALSHYYMGHYYFMLQEYETALPHLEKAYQLRPKLREVAADLAWSYHNVGRNEEAIDVLKNTIQLLPDFMSNYGNLSAIYYETGDIDKAIATLQEALKIDPMGEPIYDMLIYQYQQKGDLVNAQKYLLEAKQKGLLKNR